MARGVGRRKNGKWGARIYAKNKEIWLGTFKSEEEADLAYARASIKLKGKDNQNLTNEHIPETELYFQNRFSADEIVKMIKDHSYDKKLQMNSFPDLNLPATEEGEPMMHKPHKFCKSLTKSDTGSLSRLLIPKIDAQNHFPIDMLRNGKIIFLKCFYNHHEKLKFRFKHWTSSQSYVLTTGWRDFVKDKRLEAGDTIYFTRDNTKGSTYHITISPSQEGRDPGAVSNVSTMGEEDFKDSKPTELGSLPKEEDFKDSKPTELGSLPKEENFKDSKPTELGSLPSWGVCQRRNRRLVRLPKEEPTDLVRLQKEDFSESKPTHYG